MDAHHGEFDSIRPEDASTVMFVDMLGFAALTKANPIIRDVDFRFLSRFGQHLPHRTNQLAARFITFHGILDNAVFKFAENLMPGQTLRAMTFSDSAFIEMPSVKEAVAMAGRLMRSLIRAEVPVRIGIGCGSFILLKFRSEADTQATIQTSQFFGTAVVHAHEAERSQEKGLRIILHSSVQTLAALEDVDDEPRTLMLRPQTPIPIGAPNAAWAEINYANPGNENVDHKLMAGIGRLWHAAPPQVWPTYQTTVDAFNRMRVARGRTPLSSPW